MSDEEEPESEDLDAWEDIQEELRPGEKIEAIVFGNWGWSSTDRTNTRRHDEPDPPPVPFDARGVLFASGEGLIATAHEMMKGWSFNGGYGAPECYAVWIWTNERVFWVTQYDGSTGLNWAPRNPTAEMPDMPGG